ncbi:hypothetical protein BRPE64_BCDS10480 [Caballeronia insecticola]|uniref:Uncharacterized protein n=1 Tax=Caballeronia insecticola TaxID=758793 RepID=R4WMF9_9BURK|nr:hypothetical protein BRPE64_BCDS10480 [Caballeronia insecticola]
MDPIMMLAHMANIIATPPSASFGRRLHERSVDEIVMNVNPLRLICM